MKTEKIRQLSPWVKMWSAPGSFHFDSQLGEAWTSGQNISGRPIYRQVVFFYKDGLTDCWATKADRDDLGSRLSALARQDNSYIAQLADDLVSRAQKVTEFINSHSAADFNLANFDQFWNLVYDYYFSHISAKYVVDYLSPEELKVILPILEKARLATEPLYRDIENYVAAISERIASAAGYAKEMIMSTTKAELRKYFENNSLSDQTELSRRYAGSVLVFAEQEEKIFVGPEAEETKRIIIPSSEAKVISGQVAYQGRVRGHVKIILDPNIGASSFLEGDILVTGMTRPEFLPLLKKAAGFITDSGGILSHAAIMARELRKPCLIDTKIATTTLKDGDLVELDADSGVVNILNEG